MAAEVSIGLEGLMAKQGIVFISCGQCSRDEIELGQKLKSLVEEHTPFEGYFAQNQTTLDGLSRDVFGALNPCAGFVAVMHSRGNVATPDGSHVRASVWIEQEIAIAAFLAQAQGRRIPTAIYIQEGIKREGVREQLLLTGALEFRVSEEVRGDFEAQVVNGKFAPARVQQAKAVELSLGYEKINTSVKPHRYRLKMQITNTGTERLDNYWIELEFPKPPLGDYPRDWNEERQRATDTHRFFRATRDALGVDLYPNDPIPAMPIDYAMGEDSLSRSALEPPVIARFCSPGMDPVVVVKPFRELQCLF
jgi:hypothetical protein